MAVNLAGELNVVTFVIVEQDGGHAFVVNDQLLKDRTAQQRGGLTR